MRTVPLLVLLAMAWGLVFVACGGGGSNAAAEPLAGKVALADSDLSGFTSTGWEACGLTADGWGIIWPLPKIYEECFFSSFVTDEAYSGEGRAQIDAQTRVEGNDPSNAAGPDTPIHGPFVSTHHGIFEVYNEIYVLSSPEAAHAEFERQTSNAGEGEFAHQEIPSQLGDESMTVKRLLGSDPNQDETSIVTFWRRGRVVGMLNTMGAPDLQVDANWRLVELMDQRTQADKTIYASLPTEEPPSPEPDIDFCPPDMRFETGYLVQLAPGTVALTPHIKAPLLASSSPALSALGLDRLYVADSDDPADLPSNVEAVAPLYQTAADPELHTCDFRLEDKPAALALREAAIEYLTSTGMVSVAKFTDPSTQWYLSDDNLPDGLIAVYALIQTPAPSAFQEVVMTVFQGKQGPALGAARVNMYAAYDALSCAPEMRFQSGYLVRLASGTVPLTPRVKGPLLASPSPALSALGFDRLFVAGSNDPAELPPDVEAVVPLYLMAADSDLHTCDYKLADRPAAVALRDAALDYLTSTGVVSSAEITRPSTVWMISDTDLPGGVIAVYAQLQSPPSASGNPGERDVIMTVFQGKEGPILGAARVNLCPADSPSGAMYMMGSVTECGGTSTAEGQ